MNSRIDGVIKRKTMKKLALIIVLVLVNLLSFSQIAAVQRNDSGSGSGLEFGNFDASSNILTYTSSTNNRYCTALEYIDGPLYGLLYNNVGMTELHTLDPLTGASTTNHGPLPTNGVPWAYNTATAIAVDPTANLVYFIGNAGNTLYTIDIPTMNQTLVGSLPDGYVYVGMDFDATGNLYAVCYANNSLYQINKSNGSEIWSRPFGSGVVIGSESCGMAFNDFDGQMYLGVVLNGGSTSRRICTVSLTSIPFANVTPVAPVALAIGDGQSLTLSFPNTIALPIELATFSAIPFEKHVDLSWATSSEHDNDHFTIEKSVDLISWEAVCTLPGAGNSLQLNEYECSDLTPYDGISYYRLKQTDFNGELSLSEIIPVQFKKDVEIEIWPNPFTNKIELSISEMTDGVYYVEITDLTGKILVEREFDSIKNRLEINTEKIQVSGVYFVCIKNESSEIVYSQKIIKF